MEVSFHHNKIVTTSSCNKIYIWDYELAKLLTCLELEEGLEPTALAFINGYSILLLAANNGKLYFIQFKDEE